MPNDWLLKKFLKKEKKREKRTRKCGRKKKKKMKKKNDGRTLFIFISVTFEFGTDACFLLYYFVEIVLLKILLLSST